MKIPPTHWCLLGLFIITAYNQAKNKNSKFWFLFFVAIFFEFLTEFYSAWYNYASRQSNTWIYNFVIPLQFVLFAIPFIKTYKLKFAIIYWSVFVIFAYVRYFFWIDIAQFDSLTYQIGSFLIEIIVLSYLYKLLNQDKIQNLWLEPSFWVAIGLFVFYIGSFIFFGFLNYLLKKNPPMASAFYQIFKTLFYVLCLFFLIANIFEWKRQKSHTPSI